MFTPSEPTPKILCFTAGRTPYKSNCFYLWGRNKDSENLSAPFGQRGMLPRFFKLQFHCNLISSRSELRLRSEGHNANVQLVKPSKYARFAINYGLALES